MEEYEELVPYIKNLLRNNIHKIKISGKIKGKIEKKHGLFIEKVMSCLNDPKGLIAVEKGVPRRAHDEPYDLIFRKSRNRRIFIVILHRTLRKDLFLVTAFESSKEYEQLLKRYKNA